MLDKLENPNLYEHLKINSTNNLHDKIFHLWVKGIKAEFVTAAEKAREEEEENTFSHFKPGTRYLYPMLKINSSNRTTCSKHQSTSWISYSSKKGSVKEAMFSLQTGF